MERFVGKVAVVTGASSGIGEAISKELVKRGLIVVGLARRIGKLQTIAEELSRDQKTYIGKFYPLQCDITNELEIKNLFERVHKQIGPTSVLVNNAGILCITALQDVTGDFYNTVFDTNVKSLLLCSKEAVKAMKNNSITGHIVNINSVAGLRLKSQVIQRGNVLYSASKHVARVFSDGLRGEILDQKLNIKITDLYPGTVDTDMTKHMIHERSGNEYLMTEDITKACIFVLDTPPNVMVSELRIQAIGETF